jgi:hypothetical protein
MGIELELAQEAPSKNIAAARKKEESFSKLKCP